MLALLGLAHGQEEQTLRNPLNPSRGPDPWLVYYDGYYYLSATTGTSEWTMRKSPTLAGLKTAAPLQIYSETDPSRCCNFWAPEFYLLDGPNGPRWYFYYTAGTDGTLDNQRTHVLESAGTDPMGPYTYKARIYDPANDVWAIDGSILQLDGALYFLFSSWEGDYQSLFIAPMSNPWTISGSRVRITQSEYDWEKSGLNVTEGPVALQHDGKTFIIYSASYCATPDYALGMLTYTGGDPLSADSWVKHPEPVFQRSDENGVFGPGHNGFFKSPDGTEDWIVYHANDSESGVCDDWRTTRVQKFTWNADGTPNFGIPVALGEEIAAPSGDTGIDPMPEWEWPNVSRFRAFGLKTGYLTHQQRVVQVNLMNDNRVASQFVIVPGLSDESAVSLQSVDYPGYYVRHRDNLIWLDANDGTENFPADATWWMRPGIADENAISFESYSQPGSYIGQRFSITALVALDMMTTDRMREDATFVEEKTE